MPKRNRTKEQRSIGGHAVQQSTVHTAPVVDTEQARAAKLFAQSVRDHEAADRTERERKTAAIERERRHADLLAAKQSAAAVIRDLRADGRPRQKMAEAEAAYRVALAELTEFDTGERPHWAPPPVADDPDLDADAGDDSSEDQPS